MYFLLDFFDNLIGFRWRWSKWIFIGNKSKIEWRNIHNLTGNILAIGDRSMVRAKIHFESIGGELRIGDRCFIGRSLFACKSKIIIGNDVLISWGCTIVDHNSHPISWSKRQMDVESWRHGVKKWEDVQINPVIVEDKVWLGFGVSILKGVRIGEGSVIGAGAVVTKDIPAWSIAAGNPAKVLRTLAIHDR